MNFLTLIDYIGTFAFAISGIRLASAKRFDWFGAYVVGFVTAVGGLPWLWDLLFCSGDMSSG